MKKIMFCIALALIAVTGANAQKQQGGEKNLEVQFSPLGGSPISISGIRFRLFNSESSAIRIGLSLTNTKTTTVRLQQFSWYDGASDGTSTVILPELYDTEKSSNFGIRLGYEKHFAGTDRLSPYVGGEIMIGMGSETIIREFHNANNADDQSKPENWQTWEMERKQGTFTYGVNVVGGVDFYFADNIYLGAEIGLGVQSKKYQDSETAASSADNWKYSDGSNGPGTGWDGNNAQADGDFSDQATWNEEGTALQYNTIIGDGSGNYKERSLGTNFQSTIRLGWLF